ncbi:MAG TPA: hypothetical protein VLR27_01295 [Acidimicrobiales bacterium]|nr:hypothetical protein [Acidimicrobiales bacterium]
MQIEASRRRRTWTETDRGMLVLVKLVMADDWSAGRAAAQLVRLIRDPRVLGRLTVRVRAAQSDRPSEFGERAEQTLLRAEAQLGAA